MRQADRPRYIATLFAPPAARDDLFALYAFAAEIARVPDAVTDPTLGEIRLAWWRDRLEGGEAAGGDASPVLKALFEAIDRRRLPVAALVALVDARSRDLYSDPPADEEALEAYFGETESALFQLAGLVLGAKGPDIADASGHAGVAYGLTRRLARFGHDRRRARCIVPATMLARHGLTAADMFGPKPPPAATAAIMEASAFAAGHLDRARNALRRQSVRPAFLPLAIVSPRIARIETRLRKHEEPDGEISRLAMLTRIAWAAMRSDRRIVS